MCTEKRRSLHNITFYFNYRVGTISLLEGPLAKYGEGAKYIELFVTALRQYGMLCIGLYR